MLPSPLIYQDSIMNTWVNIFKSIPEFRIFRKLASKVLIGQIIKASCHDKIEFEEYMQQT